MLNRPRIRQLSLGELLDESFRLYRNNFLTFAAIAALVLVPYTIIGFLVQLPLQEELIDLQSQANNPNAFAGQSPFDFMGDFLFWYLSVIGVGLLYTVIFQPLLEGALAHNISRSYLGSEPGVGESFGAAVRHSPALITARLIPVAIGALIFGAIVGGVALVVVMMVGPSFSDQINTDTAVTLVGLSMIGIALLFVLTMIALAFMVRILFTSQAVIVENAGAWESLKRSWYLTQGSFWRIVGYSVVIGLLIYVLVALPAFVVSFITTMVGLDLWVQLIINTCANAVFSVLSTPFSMIAYTLLYFDLRVRKEGFDLEYQAHSLLGPNIGPVAMESQ